MCVFLCVFVCDVLNVVVVGTFKEERFIEQMKKSVCQFFFIFFSNERKFSFSSVCSALSSLQKEGKTTTTLLSSKHTHTHTKRFYTRFLWDDDDEFDH